MSRAELSRPLETPASAVDAHVLLAKRTELNAPAIPLDASPWTMYTYRND